MLKPSSRAGLSWWKKTMLEEESLISTIFRISKIFTIFKIFTLFSQFIQCWKETISYLLYNLFNLINLFDFSNSNIYFDNCSRFEKFDSEAWY